MLAYRLGRADKDPSEYWYKGEMGFFDFYIVSHQGLHRLVASLLAHTSNLAFALMLKFALCRFPWPKSSRSVVCLVCLAMNT